MDLLSIAILQSTTNKRFAFPIVIWIGSVNVIYPMINGISKHRCCLFFIDIAIFFDRQAHASESKNGEVNW